MISKFLSGALAFVVLTLSTSANAGLINLVDFKSSATKIDFSDAIIDATTYSKGIFSISGGNVDNLNIVSMVGGSYSTRLRPAPGIFRLDFSSFVSAVGMSVYYNSSNVAFKLYDVNNILLDSSLSSPTQYGQINGFVGLNTGINNIAYALIDVPGRVNIHDLYIDNVIFQQTVAVPAPGSFALLGLGLMFLASRRFKKSV